MGKERDFKKYLNKWTITGALGTGLFLGVTGEAGFAQASYAMRFWKPEVINSYHSWNLVLGLGGTIAGGVMGSVFELWWEESRRTREYIGDGLITVCAKSLGFLGRSDPRKKIIPPFIGKNDLKRKRKNI